MKKAMLLVSMLAIVALAVVPAMAQDGGDANLAQEQNNAAFGGDSNAAAGNNFSAQNQEASNSAETDVAQEQVGVAEQNASSEGGDVSQFLAVFFGNQSADVETNQANTQEQSNEQTATDNTATADSSADATSSQDGTATGGAGGDQYGGAADDQYVTGDDDADDVGGAL